MQDIANIGDIFITVFYEMSYILLFHIYENYTICPQSVTEIIVTAS
jgi:hypothetical protein